MRKAVVSIVAPILLASFASVASAERLAVAPSTSNDRPETLTDMYKIGSGVNKVGGYGGPLVRWGKIAGRDAAFAGGRGGVIINHQLIFGGTGMSLATDSIPAPKDSERNIGLNLGGLTVGYTFFPQEVLHATALATSGWGNLTYNREDEDGENNTISDSVNFVEPEVLFEANVTKWFHAGLSLSYRHLAGVDKNKVTESAMRGFTAGMAFNFGNF